MLYSTLSIGLSKEREVCGVLANIAPHSDSQRQVNINYSFANALTHNMNNIGRVISFYDINCSYTKKLRAQIQNNKFIRLPLNLNILPWIRIWHVHRHQASCFAQYVPLFIPGAGWVDGEIIETLWSNLNIVSGSTRGMSFLHCQELLDFQMNDSNFVKMIRISTYSPLQPVNDLNQILSWQAEA